MGARELVLKHSEPIDIANEEEVFVYGTSINDYHSLEYSSFIPFMVKGMQEMYTEITNLKEKIKVK